MTSRTILGPALALTLLGCGNNGDPTGGTTSTTGGGGGAGGAGGSAQSVPLVDAALDGHCPGGKPPGTGASKGDDLHKVTLSDYPDAVCNDGTPAIMYVRAASSAATKDRWVFHMQAGGSCNSYEVCLDRWCGIGAYDAAKMSSSFAPEVASGTGILSRGANNAFGSANQVYIYYCSSDSWMGRKSDLVLEDPDGLNVPFRLHFRGHDILEAAATALAKGVTSDDGVESLPSLTDAKEALFTGSSAGSQGLSEHLDWWVTKVPNATQTAGMLDSIFLPIEEDIDDPTIAANYELLMRSYNKQRVELYDAYFDESCMAMHPADEQYLCGNPGYLQLNHITTPFFSRQDLTDPVAYQYLEIAGATLQQYAKWTLATMKRLPDIQANAAEKSAITTTPGAYASNCAQHIALLNGPWFGLAQTNATVETSDGTPLTLHDGLAAWATGTKILALDTQPSTVSFCPATTSEQ